MKKAAKVIGKALLGLVGLILIFLLAVFIFHRFRLNKEKEIIGEPIGQMVEVDGKDMCVYTEGEGEHTIVFMSGYGTPSPILDFKPLYSRLTSDNKIAVVEKFGYGYSDETDDPRDVDTMLRQTREALEKAGVQPPYILCPHSASGIEAFYWAQTHPEEIEGIAALDIAIPGTSDSDSIFLDKAMYYLVNSGIFRLVDTDSLDWGVNSPDLTDDEKAKYKALIYARRGSKTMIHEAEWCKENLQKISDGGAPDVPMIFFISKQQAKVQLPDDPERYMRVYRDFTDNKQEYIDMECSHYVHVQEPDFIAEKIREFEKKL